jgi:UDP-glucose 4-epimerase
LRYFNPVGAHTSGLIAENPCGIPNNLMPYIVKVARGDLPELKIFGNDYPTPDGTGIRDYIHVMDLAEGHVASLEYLDKFKGFDVFNLGSGLGISVLELVLSFEKMCGIGIKYQYTARRQGDLAAYYANPARANKILNWNSKRTLYDIVKSSWESNKQI